MRLMHSSGTSIPGISLSRKLGHGWAFEGADASQNRDFFVQAHVDDAFHIFLKSRDIEEHLGL